MGRATKKEKKIIDLATKKTIHVTMSVSSHTGFRIECFKHKVSMQEALEEFARLVSIGHNDSLAVLKSVQMRKISNQIKALDNDDADTIYNILELENPLKDNT
jgi:hypothetical protein